eukprot:376839-Rhodomonas_salina.1
MLKLSRNLIWLTYPVAISGYRARVPWYPGTGAGICRVPGYPGNPGEAALGTAAPRLCSVTGWHPSR